MRVRLIRRNGFSLVELVVVIVIIGILAAMAIPRLSRGSAGAADASLTGNLAILRNAIQHYAAEHNGAFPTAAKFTEQLTKYTSAAGADSATKDATHKYGPYLLAIPGCPVISGAAANTVLFDATNSPPAVDTTNGEGWVYNPNTGEIRANTNAADSTGKNYKDY